MINIIILAGGNGTRLWPSSVPTKPKQFMHLSNMAIYEHILSLFEDNNLFRHIFFSANISHSKILLDKYKNNKKITFLFEERSLGTTLATFLCINKLNKNDIFLVLNVDQHLFCDDFIPNIIKGCNKVIANNTIVLFGVDNSKNINNNDYTYIGIDEQKNIQKFYEKNTINLQENNKYLLYTGIFIAKVGVILKHINYISPKIIDYIKKIEEFSYQYKNRRYFFFDEDIDIVSIENILISKINANYLDYVKLNYWYDLGNWDSLKNNSSVDCNNNYSIGNISLDNVRNSYIVSTKNITRIQNCEDIIVINNDNGLFIKKINDKFINFNLDDIGIIYSKWGFYIYHFQSKYFVIKSLFFTFKGATSLQKHLLRDEYVFVIKGKILLQYNKGRYILKENEIFFIEKYNIHKITNVNIKGESVVLELQIGKDITETDIIRYQI
ncbi:MAG: sugar phosphate nucleotidyltransferase [Anaplasmataceae bacterium]|nr:sugar phosphate nucleotidyltransferase [Anaplasmataceae bacterium]